MRHKRRVGFTLAELLIALAILGVIATFTIPKILNAQQNGQFNAEGKEAISMLSGAFQAYTATHTISASTSMDDLTPYMNYVGVDGSRDIDLYQTGGTVNCGGSNQVCLKFHNGGIMRYLNCYNFGGTATTNALYVSFDPDGKVTDGTANGPGKALTIFIYTNGRISTWADVDPATMVSGIPFTPSPSSDPPWFSW